MCFLDQRWFGRLTMVDCYPEHELVCECGFCELAYEAGPATCSYKLVYNSSLQSTLMSTNSAINMNHWDCAIDGIIVNLSVICLKIPPVWSYKLINGSSLRIPIDLALSSEELLYI